MGLTCDFSAATPLGLPWKHGWQDAHPDFWCDHADAHASCGFCVFNSVAVGALWALAKHPEVRVAQIGREYLEWCDGSVLCAEWGMERALGRG